MFPRLSCSSIEVATTNTHSYSTRKHDVLRCVEPFADAVCILSDIIASVRYKLPPGEPELSVPTFRVHSWAGVEDSEERMASGDCPVHRSHEVDEREGRVAERATYG